MFRTINVALARRIREIREETYGVDLDALAASLGIPARTWSNYEAGVTIPAEILLGFIEITGVRPSWLLSGTGTRYTGR